MKNLLLLFVSLLFGTICLGQKGWQKDLEIAHAYFENHAFKQSIIYYERVSQVKKIASVYENLGHSYFHLRQFKDANRIYNLTEKYFGTNTENTLRIARTELYLGNYQKTKELLHQIKDTTFTKEKDLLLASSDSILKWNKQPQTVKVANLKSINSSASEIAPLRLNNELIFSSDRMNITYKRSFEQTGSNFFNLYSTSLNEKNKWQEVKSYDTEINSPNHEGAACFSNDGEYIYFTRSEYTQSENLNHSDENRLKLYKSSKTKDHWSQPLWFMMNDSLHSFGHPSISEDGNFFFFVADLPGGFGGTDIYLSIRLTDTTWSKPINLGENINSAKNELYPHYTAQNILYFTSNGHPGYGAYDIYQTEYSKGKWTTAKNLGKGINSSYDDFSIFFTQPKRGYFSSNRPGGKGREDLYLFISK